MATRSYAKIAEAVVTIVAIVLAGMSIKAPRAHADDDDTNSKIRIGFKIAPVPLNLEGKDRELVGLGSYIVDAQGDCNGCHSADPATEFAPGGNPYFGQPTKINNRDLFGWRHGFWSVPRARSVCAHHLAQSDAGQNWTA